MDITAASQAIDMYEKLQKHCFDYLQANASDATFNLSENEANYLLRNINVHDIHSLQINENGITATATFIHQRHGYESFDIRAPLMSE